MAKVAADRRDEGLWPADPGAGRDRSPGAEAPPPNEALVRAERIRANAARLRELHIDLATCEQIDAVVATILSAAALRNPADPRVRQLADVLGHLERRIQAMLDDATRVAPAPRDVLPVKSETSKDDPLAALMALSDEERIALFS